MLSLSRLQNAYIVAPLGYRMLSLSRLQNAYIVAPLGYKCLASLGYRMLTVRQAAHQHQKCGRSSYIKNRSMGAACTDLQRQTNLLKHRDNTVGEK
jgi:hypothetical protein